MKSVAIGKSFRYRVINLSKFVIVYFWYMIVSCGRQPFAHYECVAFFHRWVCYIYRYTYTVSPVEMSLNLTTRCVSLHTISKIKEMPNNKQKTRSTKKNKNAHTHKTHNDWVMLAWWKRHNNVFNHESCRKAINYILSTRTITRKCKEWNVKTIRLSLLEY